MITLLETCSGIKFAKKVVQKNTRDEVKMKWFTTGDMILTPAICLYNVTTNDTCGWDCIDII